MCVQKLVATLGLVLVLVSSGAALAQLPTAAELAADPERSAFGAQVILGTAVGSGTFISDPYSDHPEVLQSLDLRPSYRIGGMPVPTILSIRQTFSLEYTQPENVNGRKWDYGDTQLSLASPSLWVEENTGLRLAAALGLSLPISHRSRIQRKYTSISLAPTLSATFGDFYLGASAGVSKSFHRFTSRVYEEEDLAFDELVGGRCRSGESYCSGGPFLVSWSMSTSGRVAYNFLEHFSATFLLGWDAAWSYETPRDEHTSMLLEDRGRSRLPDQTMAVLDLSYDYSETLAFSLGGATRQPLRSSDDRGARNLLYDGSPRNNYSSLYLDVVASF